MEGIRYSLVILAYKLFHWSEVE